MTLRLDNKNIFIQAVSVVDGVDAVAFSTTVSSSGDPEPIYRSIINQEVYTSKQSEVREDLAKFQNEAYKLQDSLIAEVKANVETDKEG